MKAKLDWHGRSEVKAIQFQQDEEDASSFSGPGSEHR